MLDLFELGCGYGAMVVLLVVGYWEVMVDHGELDQVNVQLDWRLRQMNSSELF